MGCGLGVECGEEIMMNGEVKFGVTGRLDLMMMVVNECDLW